MKLRTLAAVLALITLGGAPASWAQGSGSLSVSIKDNYGALPGTTVRLVDKDGRSTARAVTDGSGVARFSSVVAGEYTIKANLTGFADGEKGGVSVGNTEEKVELILTLARFSTTVTVTTANRREQLLLDVAEPTTLIDEAQILDTGSRSAKDILLQQAGSGVQVNAGGGQGHLSINGIPNSGVLVLIDGRRYLGRDANGNFNLEEIQMAGLERIEVVKGPGSALYGADALGGVVNFVTQKAKNPGWRNTLSGLGGTYSDFRGNDSVSYRGAKGSATAYGSYRTYDGFDLEPLPDPPINPQTMGQPASKFKSAGFSGDYQFSSKVVGRLFADFNDRHMDPYYFSGATQTAASVYNSIRDLKRYMVSPELEFSPRSDLSFNLTYNYGKYVRDETRVFVVGGAVQPQAPWREWNDELKLTGRYSWTAGGRQHPLQAGFERRTEQLTRATLNRKDPERDINVVWLQQEVNLGAKLKLSGGFRYDDYSDFGTRTSPKATAVYALASQHRLRATFGEGFRPPLFGELYLSTPPSFVGNPNLKPEESRGYTAGYTFSGPKAQVSLDWFRTDIENGIVFDLTRVPFTYGNLRKYSSKGASGSVAFSLPKGFTPSADYTYNRRTDANGVEIGGFPKHAAHVKLLWSNQRLGLRANVRGEFNGEVPPGITDTSLQPAYKVAYAQISKTFARRGAYGVSVWGQVSNIFDRKDIYRLQTCPATGAPAGCQEGRPLNGALDILQVWIAPRTFQAGITIDMDWTR